MTDINTVTAPVALRVEVSGCPEMREQTETLEYAAREVADEVMR
jgi:hypothetical protein